MDDRYWQKLEDIDSKLDDLRILVAGKYVTKKEFATTITILLTILLALVAAT